MPYFLLAVSLIIFACVVCNKISGKLGIPMLLAFILLGMFFGSDGVVKIAFDNFSFAEQICSVALILIMFYGGFGTNWRQAKPVAAQAVVLSTLGVVLTAALTGLFCYFVLRIELLESFLIGALISSTDAASMFSILRSRRLNLKDNTDSLLEVESGSNDPCSYMLTAILLSIMAGTASGGEIAYLIFAQLFFGVAFGAVISLLALWVLKRFRFGAGFDAALVLAIAVISYAAPSVLGGNGYLSAYIVGIVLGNSPIPNKKALVHFFDGLTGLMQMLIFFLLGLLAFPSLLPQVALPALLIALFLTFVARPAAVFSLLLPFRCKLRTKLLISWAGLRGAASIVFAIMATTHPAQIGNDVFHMIFFIVLFSILIQGSLLPAVARKLNMYDPDANVLRSFTDFTDEIPIRFVQFTIPPGHSWAGKYVSQILLPPGTILVLLRRGNKKIVPRGNTEIREGDTFVLSAKTPETVEGAILTELAVDKGSPWVGRPLSEIEPEPGRLVILILRNGKANIPNGNTVLHQGDLLVLHQEESAE